MWITVYVDQHEERFSEPSIGSTNWSKPMDHRRRLVLRMASDGPGLTMCKKKAVVFIIQVRYYKSTVCLLNFGQTLLLFFLQFKKKLGKIAGVTRL
jgi:hypothetical protein